MSAGQLAFFRRRLLADEQALLSAVKATAGHLQESETSSDWNDRASAEEEHTLELRVRDRERKLLQKIREALRASTTATTVGARRPAKRSASPGFWHGRRRRCASKHRSVANRPSAAFG
jgi:RNA polymerase-binding protein DksA